MANFTDILGSAWKEILSREWCSCQICLRGGACRKIIKVAAQIRDLQIANESFQPTQRTCGCWLQQYVHRKDDEIKPLQVGDYVLATKWADGNPQDHWYVGFFAGMLPMESGDRYKVIDKNGNLARGNGFRRAKKISAKRGKWILDHRQDIALSDKSLWWWVRQKMK